LKPPKILFLLLVAAAAFGISPAFAQSTWFVAPPPTGNDSTGDGSLGSPFATIQFVYTNVIAAGDTIRLLPGEHDGCGVALAEPSECASSPEACWFDSDCPGTDTCIRSRHVNIDSQAFVDSQDASTTIIRSGTSCPAGTPVIVIGQGSSISGVTVRNATGSGIVARGSSTVTHNIIDATSGGGVFVYTANCYYGDTTTTVTDNVISNNRAEFADGNPDSGNGGGVYVKAQLPDDCGQFPQAGSGVVVVDNNIVENNSAEIAGGGVYAFTNTTSSLYSMEVQITNNTIDGNLAGIPGAPGLGGTGGGIFTTTFGYYDETIQISDNLVRVNTATGSGGGITAQIDSLVLANHTVSVSDNTVTGNVAVDDGGGLNLFLYAQDLDPTQSLDLSARDNTATGNMCSGLAAGGGGLLAIFQSIRSSAPNMSFAVEDNRITDNVAEVIGGGVSLLASAEADDESLPVPDGMLAPALAEIDFNNNLVARNDAIDMGGGVGGGAGGGVFTFLLAFGEATATTDMSLNTVVENSNELGSGGIEIEVFTGLDNQMVAEGQAVVEVGSSTVSDNVGFGIGGPFPGGGTANLDLVAIEFCDFYNNTDVIGTGIKNYEDWVNDRTGVSGNISVHPLLSAFPDYAPDVCSPTVDSADPALDFSLEPAPNGGVANMGHTGGTALATTTPGPEVCEVFCIDPTVANDVGVVNLSCDQSGPFAVGTTNVPATCTGALQPAPRSCPVTVALPDPTGDGSVDGVDVLRISTAFGAVSGEPRYLLEADLDGTCAIPPDPCVDGDDLALISPQYGFSCP
jgi:hypothetical protein